MARNTTLLLNGEEIPVESIEMSVESADPGSFLQEQVVIDARNPEIDPSNWNCEMDATIELCDNHKERVAEIRETVVEGTELSELTDSMLMDILLDTYEAVDAGLYRDCQTPDWKLEEQVEKWRDKQDELTLPRSGLTDEGVAYKRCADQLEELIGDGDAE